MKIEQIRINGVREPVGFALPYLEVSFKVTETVSKKPADIRITLLDASGAVLTERRGEALDMTGETLDAALAPRTSYTVRVAVTGDAGDFAEAESHFETGKMNEPWAAEWTSRRF